MLHHARGDTMDNQELLEQVIAVIQEQTEVLTGLMDTKIRESEERIDQRITKLEIKIENDVTKRIDALFDGYKLTHEKQWELEREVENIKRRLELLEAKAG